MFKIGNLKLNNQTLIFNMGTATNCQSKKLGLCKVCNNNVLCYAEKAERIYKHVLPYREKQKIYWLSNTSNQIIKDMETFIGNRIIKYIRINESGDFHTQDCVNKLNKISLYFKNKGIIVYGYTARIDLDYTGVSFIIRASGYKPTNGMTGATTIIKKNRPIPKGYFKCVGDCTICNKCMKKHTKNIAFLIH